MTISGRPRRFTIWSTATCLLTLAALPAIFGRGSAAEARREAPATASLAIEQENPAPRGIAAYVPTGARGQGDDGILEGVAQMAIPLVRTATFPAGAPAAFFSAHALGDRHLLARLGRFLNGGGRALVTSRLAARLGDLPHRYADRVFVIATNGGTAGLMKLPQGTLDSVRNFILFPMGLNIQAPPRVALVVYGERELRVTNRNPYAAGMRLAFRRPIWPEITAIRTADDETSVPVDYNLAQLQIAPGTTRSLRIVTAEHRG